MYTPSYIIDDMANCCFWFFIVLLARYQKYNGFKTKEDKVNAKELFNLDDKNNYVATGIYFCDKCRIVHRNKDAADECCMPHPCTCGEKVDTPYTRQCSKCRDRIWAEERHKRFEAMPIVEYNGEPLYYNEEYYPDKETLLDSNYDILDGFLDAQICDVQKLGQMNSAESLADDIEENMLCEMDECIELKHKDKLIEVLREWLKTENAKIWIPINKRVKIKTSRDEE